MAKVRTLSKGQIVIPAEIRKRYHIEPGTEMQIMDIFTSKGMQGQVLKYQFFDSPRLPRIFANIS